MTKVTAILLAAALVAGLLLESRQMRAQGRSGATRQMCPCRRRALGNSLWSRLVQMHRAVWQEPLCPGGGVDRQADLCEEVRAAVEVSKGRGQCRCHRLRGLPSRQGVRQPNALCRAETIWSTSVEGKSPHDMRGLFSGCLHCRAVLLRSMCMDDACLSAQKKNLKELTCLGLGREHDDKSNYLDTIGCMNLVAPGLNSIILGCAANFEAPPICVALLVMPAYPQPTPPQDFPGSLTFCKGEGEAGCVGPQSRSDRSSSVAVGDSECSLWCRLGQRYLIHDVP
eukprot:CAMPEP_0183393884 /NCGR_PEP_ID=MMETSP0370-20130417/8198_1 /TAXON_ID=268820 /ORGANISM="Peridinium aciculiferum, Strain PAER-2" /LENGTH=282 /DNA_ID=CAMNT_0025574163 /DNA_START=113 /DNA_END=959 /DNA_ORIENTATION=-